MPKKSSGCVAGTLFFRHSIRRTNILRSEDNKKSAGKQTNFVRLAKSHKKTQPAPAQQTFVFSGILFSGTQYPAKQTPIYIWKGNTGVWKENGLGQQIRIYLLSAGPVPIGSLCGKWYGHYPWKVVGGTNGGGAFVLTVIFSVLIVLGHCRR